MDVQILGRVRKTGEAVDAEASGADDRVLTLSQQLELLMAAGAAQYQEIVRPGRSFFVTAVAAVAAVIAVPTTAVMLALFNNEEDGGASLVIDWVGASGVAKTAAAGQAQLLVLPGQVREAAPTDAALPIKKSNGLGGGAGDHRVRTILTATALPAATGLAANWIPLGPSVGFPGAAATPGHGLWAPVDGRFIVPPGRYFAMHVLADVVGSTFLPSIGFTRKQIELG